MPRLPNRRSTSYRRGVLGVLALAAVLAPGGSEAGEVVAVDNGDYSECPVGGQCGEITIDLYIPFSPTGVELDRAEAQFRRASQILCDATEGGVRISKVRVGDSLDALEKADVIWMPEGSRGNSKGDEMKPFGDNVTLIHGGNGPDPTPLIPGDSEAQVKGIMGLTVAHELGHSVLGLFDSYDDQRRYGEEYGFGPAIDGTETELVTSLMETPKNRQICYNKTGYLPGEIGEVAVPKTPCFSDGQCAQTFSNNPNFICPATPELSTELLTDDYFDTVEGLNSGSYPGPRAGDTLFLDGYVAVDAPLAPSATWSSLDSWTGSNSPGAKTSVEDEPREFVDDIGKLDGWWVVKEGGSYEGSSHEVHLFLAHSATNANWDEWRLYAMIDGGELDSEGTEGKPHLLEWDIGGTPQDFLDLKFDLTGAADFSACSGTNCCNSASSSNCEQDDEENMLKDQHDVAYDTDCWKLSEAAGQPIFGGESTFADLDLEFPDFSNGASPAVVEAKFHDGDSGFLSGFMACKAAGGMGGEDPVPAGDLDRYAYNFNSGTRFEAAGESQLGACPQGEKCEDKGFLALWHNGNQRFEGSNQRRRINNLIDKFTGSGGDKEPGYSHIDLIYDDGTGDVFPADWDVLNFRLQHRFGITLAGNPGRTNTPDPDIDTHAFCDDADQLEWDESGLQEADTTIVLLDRSGSMKQNAPDGGTKMDWAETAIENWASMAENSGQRVGLWAFAGTPQKFYPTSGSETGEELTSANDVEDYLDALEKVGFDTDTAIGDALAAVGDAIEGDEDAKRTNIVLYTDGKHNWGDKTCEEGIDHVNDLKLPISINAVPIAGIELECLDEAASDTGGMVLPTKTRQLPNTMMRLYAATRAEDLYPGPWRSKVAWNLGGYPQTEGFNIDVEPEGGRLLVLLTNMHDILSEWTVDFTLYGPNSEEITKATPGAWRVDPDLRTGFISVDLPSPGTWNLVMESVQPAGGENGPQDTMIQAHIEHLGPLCDASLSSRVVTDDGEGVRIFAETSWSGVTIIDDVQYTANVTRPDGSEISVPLSEGEEKRGYTGLFTDFVGSGYYIVDVTCEVGAEARYHPGESEDDDAAYEKSATPDAYKRGARVAFTADLGEWYFDDLASDCDEDGFPNGDEGVPSTGLVDYSLLPDTDGDGVPDACDIDSDGDELPDANEADDDTDGDGTDDRLDVDSDDDGEMDGADEDPLDPAAHLYVAYGDFDGDGVQDRASGDQTYSSWRGRVAVVYGGTDGTSEYWNGASSGDLYGAALAAGDIDGDGYDDLIVGAPSDDHSGDYNAGSIQVLYGTSTGLTSVGTQIIHQDTPGIAGGAEPYDYFGDRLEVGDFDADGFGDVAVGVPREAIGSSSDSGAVQIIYGAAGGLSTQDDMWYQGSGGVNGARESWDRFGDTLAVGKLDDDAFDDLAIGIPAEHIGSVADAGMVYVMYGTTTGLETAGDFSFSQNTSGAAGTQQAYDRLGDRFWISDRDGDGNQDLTALVPGDGCGAGSKGFQVVYGTAGGLSLSGNIVQCADSYRSGLAP